MVNDAKQFGEGLRRYTLRLERMVELKPYVDAVAESVVFGSPLTGSPGQPHDLREGQWTTVYESPTSALTSTSDPSARSVEDGLSHKYGGPITLNSPIGGFHSLALTALGWPTIVETVAKRAAGDG